MKGKVNYYLRYAYTKSNVREWARIEKGFMGYDIIYNIKIIGKI